MANCSRRNLFKLAGAGSLALLLPMTSRLGSAFAQEHLDPNSPQAKALGYVHDTNAVDEGKWASHDASQNCANCQLAQDSGGEWIGCAIFPGKQVNRNGWCSAWVQAQG
ncbi:MAG: high-potential iron-sulfur protein [Wenzhouxiangellaceae bacterium]|nr:high-potential iron-sulfur protein [Wenzhouxiangellaceae bacterium]